MKTHVPFNLKIRVLGEEVSTELYEQIKKAAEENGWPIEELEATIKLAPIPPDGKDGHYISAQVTHTPTHA